ncbi:MAG TPA: methyltransferase domain-containing protein, partial [Bacteroidia bacterium]|nr:methyltransferase domain-containing protein [Bacteroidia bacterium]
MSSTETVFNEYAPFYDEHFTRSLTGTMQRKRVWKFLSRNISVKTHRNVLELNCGTGEDALWFSDRGFNITATDLSPEMVAVTKEKLQGFAQVAFVSDIRDVASQCGGRKFNLVFSDFGGMNCLGPDELKKCAAQFSGLLETGGRLVFVVMSRNCRWEQRYFRRKDDRESAYRRRSKEGIGANVFGQEIFTWYYSPEEFAGLFAGFFRVRKFRPIGYAIPPSYLDRWLAKRKLLAKLLGLAESVCGNFSRLSDKADHFIIDLEKIK